ncbi:MAG: hypothetical protein ACREWG_10750 [Gammaproteobacteria bacterium]
MLSTVIKGLGELAARATRRVRYAVGFASVPPGEIRTVRLKLTRQGKRTRSMLVRQLTRRVRGLMEIRSTVGIDTIDTIRLTVRLR